MQKKKSRDCRQLTLNNLEDAFKLASYGVKQGGIGSILAGGFNLKRTGTSSNRASLNERPISTNSSIGSTEPHAPSIPTKPHPSLMKPTDNTTTNSAKLNINTAPELAKSKFGYSFEVILFIDSISI